MSKFKKIIGCGITGVLALAMSVTSLGYSKYAKADATSGAITDNTSYFATNNNVTLTAGAEIPDYILDRGYWSEDFKTGVKATFNAVGEENALETSKTFSVSELSTVLSFVALPSKSIFSSSKVEFKNLYVSIYEVDENGNQKGTSEVNFVYNSSSNYAAGMNSQQVSGGEASAYPSVYAINANGEVQKPGAYRNNGSDVFASSKDPSVTGALRMLSSGAGASTNVHASMQDSKTRFSFTYSQDDGVVRAGATPLKSGYPSTMRILNEYRDPKTITSTSNINEYTENADGTYTPSYKGAGLVDDNVIFDGFSADAKLKVKLYIDSFAHGASSANFLLFKVGNVALFDRINVHVNYYGEKGVAYPIPSCKYVDVDGVEGSNVPYTVTVKDANDSDCTVTKTGEINYFTPTAAGNYTLTYTAAGCTKTVTVEIKDKLEDISLSSVTQATEFNKVYGSEYKVYAETSSSAYIDDTTPDLTVELMKKGGTNYTKVQDLELNQIVNIKKMNLGFGEYKVVYTAKDILGRTKVSEVVLSILEENRVTYALLNGVDGKTENYYYGMTDEDFVISVSDVTIYDGINGRNFITPVVTITDTEGTSTVVNSSIKFGDYFTSVNGKSGIYTVKYVYSGSITDSYSTNFAINKTFTKYINAIDCVSPTITPVTDRYIGGAKIDNEKTTTSSAIYFNAKKGTVIRIDGITAIDKVGETYSLTDRIGMTVILPSGAIDTQNATFNPAGFDYTLTDNGTYVFEFKVSDTVNGEANLTSTLVYIVEVKDNFYSMTATSNYDVDNNVDTITLGNVKVVDFDGNNVNVETVITAYDYKGDVVWTGTSGDVKSFVLVGEYKIVTEAKLNGTVIASKTDVVSIKDKKAPEITVSGDLITEGLVGRKIKLPTVKSKDDNDVSTLTVDITLNGKTINTYKDAFTPEKAGTYVVVYTAIDISGNVGTYTYEITVIEDETAALASFFNGAGIAVAIVLLLGAAVFTLYVVKPDVFKKLLGKKESKSTSDK